MTRGIPLRYSRIMKPNRGRIQHNAVTDITMTLVVASNDSVNGFHDLRIHFSFSCGWPPLTSSFAKPRNWQTAAKLRRAADQEKRGGGRDSDFAGAGLRAKFPPGGNRSGGKR